MNLYPRPEAVGPGLIRALSLLSGGLDSQLAIRLLQSQGIEVHAIVFKSVFFSSSTGEKAGIALNVPTRIEDFTPAILSILQNPKHGFGAHMNPCIDCHIGMLRRAGQIMEEHGYHFISTGEVLSQRPMSQNRRALDLIASESGYREYVLRPLSAKRLAPSVPEQRGWVNRELLLDLQGRSRKPQIALAEQFGIVRYSQPAGGCLLTEPAYCRRLKDLKEHEGLEKIGPIELLRVGRHFRIGDIKLIVGRHEKDNELIENVAGSDDLVLKSERFPGPTALLPHTAQESDVMQAAAICARYGDCPADDMAKIMVCSRHGSRTVSVIPANHELVDSLRL